MQYYVAKIVNNRGRTKQTRRFWFCPASVEACIRSRGIAAARLCYGVVKKRRTAIHPLAVLRIKCRSEKRNRWCVKVG